MCYVSVSIKALVDHLQMYTQVDMFMLAYYSMTMDAKFGNLPLPYKLIAPFFFSKKKLVTG